MDLIEALEVFWSALDRVVTISKSVLIVAWCGIRGHDLRYLNDWAGRWALCHGWWLYECRRCRKRIRRDEELMIGGRYV